MGQTRKSRNKSGIIGKGRFGCVVKPAFTCSKTAKTRKALVSKLYATIKSNKFLPEIEIADEVLKRIGPAAHDYFVLPIAKCDLTDSQKKLSIVRACEKALDSKKQLDSFLQIPEAEGDLEHFLKDQQAIDRDEVVSALRNLIIGIKLLHGSRIVHDDIKPDNILYGHDSAGKLWFKFTDFGIGKVDATKYYRQDVKRLANVINKFLKAMNRQLLNEAEAVASFNITNSMTSSFNSKNIYIHTSGIDNIDELLKVFDAKMKAYN